MCECECAHECGFTSDLPQGTPAAMTVTTPAASPAMSFLLTSSKTPLALMGPALLMLACLICAVAFTVSGVHEQPKLVMRMGCWAGAVDSLARFIAAMICLWCGQPRAELRLITQQTLILVPISSQRAKQDAVNDR